MGLLDDAIREHLDLKRRRGADPTEIERAEREALGPVRREPLAPEGEIPAPVAGIEAPIADVHAPIADIEAPIDDPRALRGHEDDLDVVKDVAQPEPTERPDANRDPDAPAESTGGRRGGGGHSLFGRLRRSEHAEDVEESEEPKESVRRLPPEHDEYDPVVGVGMHHTFDEHAPGSYDDDWDDEEFEDDDYELEEHETSAHSGQGTVAFHPPSEWDEHEESVARAEPIPPPPHLAGGTSPVGPPPVGGDVPLTPTPPTPAPGEDDGLDQTMEYDVESTFPDTGHQDTPAQPKPARAQGEPAEAPGEQEDVLEETPEFLQDTPDHDRLWFEQRPPRDFDFDD